MKTSEIIDKYYKLANANDWDPWCDLFAEDVKMDEQLAGRIEGLAPLREMMGGMNTTFSRFQNVPIHVVIDGDQAAVVSHISAVVAVKPDQPIEADVVNYFQMREGKIAYFKNVHDTRPFDPLTQS